MNIKFDKGDYSILLEPLSLSSNQTITLPDTSGTIIVSSQLASVALSGSYNDLSNKPSLHKVATSGSYNDLSNKPNIPSTPNGYVTNSWRSGANWYRVWSNGWIEQGGVASFSNAQSGTVKFNKTFGHSPSVVWTPLTQTICEANLKSVSTSNFSWMFNVGGRTGSSHWYACGY